jgi:hypothetical protein
MKRILYNTWYFYNRIDGRHNIVSYLRWMMAVI